MLFVAVILQQTSSGQFLDIVGYRQSESRPNKHTVLYGSMPPMYHPNRMKSYCSQFCVVLEVVRSACGLLFDPVITGIGLLTTTIPT